MVIAMAMIIIVKMVMVIRMQTWENLAAEPAYRKSMQAPRPHQGNISPAESMMIDDNIFIWKTTTKIMIFCCEHFYLCNILHLGRVGSADVTFMGAACDVNFVNFAAEMLTLLTLLRRQKLTNWEKRYLRQVKVWESMGERKYDGEGNKHPYDIVNGITLKWYMVL